MNFTKILTQILRSGPGGLSDPLCFGSERGIRGSVGFSMDKRIHPYKKYGFFEPKKKSMGFLNIGFRRSRKKIWVFSGKPKKILIFSAKPKKIWIFSEKPKNMGFQIEFSHDFWIGNVSFFNFELTKYNFVFIL